MSEYSIISRNPAFKSGLNYKYISIINKMYFNYYKHFVIDKFSYYYYLVINKN